MRNFAAGGTKLYANFERCLTDWAAFEEAVTSAEPHWFKDLLALWRPSGHSSGETGLRLAIRNDYLNFYRCGQSVARVECVSGKLVADVHYKYVLGTRPGYAGPTYLRLNTKGVFSGGDSLPVYEGLSTLLHWVSVAGGEKYAGVEKSIVDELVEKNEHVVDLEMAIPAWDHRKVAVRMDLVAIEEGKIVFWEVKTVDDSRIRCKAEFMQDQSPHVLKQLSNYRDFLKEETHVAQVECAYRNASRLLVKFRELADEIGPRLALGPSIVAAAQAPQLTVARLASLVVVDLKEAPERRAWNSWKAGHESKLVGKIPMLVLENPESLKRANLRFVEDVH